MQNNWSNELWNSLQLVPVRNSLSVQLNQFRLLISPNHQRGHKHSQLSSLSSQKILDPGRKFLISYTFHKSIPFEVLPAIAQGLGAYTWKFRSQMVEPHRSFASELCQGTLYPS